MLNSQWIAQWIAAVVLLAATPAWADADRHIVSLRLNGAWFGSSTDDNCCFPGTSGGLLPSDSGPRSLWPFAVGVSVAYERRLTPRQAVGLIGEVWRYLAPFSTQAEPKSGNLMDLLMTWRYFFTLDHAGGSFMLLGVGSGVRNIGADGFNLVPVLGGKVQLGHAFALSDVWALSASLDVNGGYSSSRDSGFYFQPGVSLGVHAVSF
jgi:hypothetical protein